MADDAQYETHKRKYEEDTSTPPPPPRRSTGFSAPIVSKDADAPPQTASYNHVPPPMDEFQLAKQKLQELASRAFNAEAKRSKADNGGFGSNLNASSDQKLLASNVQVVNSISPVSHSYTGSKKIEIPNGRVGVIIGRAGETIKYLQIQSGAKIQVTRDANHDPNLHYRIVELMGNQDQIAKAEQLINEVLAEADTGGHGSVSRRSTGAAGSEQFSMKVANNKVGLVIGKGGETIKNIQATSGARVQVIPLHPPPGDTSNERTVQIDGTSEQIEVAKQMVNEVIESRHRSPAMAGGYPQQGYQARPPTSWAPQSQSQSQPPQVQQPSGYGYMQQPPYSGYPQPAPGGGYAQNWDPSNAPQNQQAPQGAGYDYYAQQPPPQPQQPPSSGPPTGNTGYNYNQPAYGQQAYSQDGYAQPGYGYGYGQPPANPGYSSAPGYGQDGQPGAQGETGQGPPPQQGYMGQPSPNPNPGYPTHGSNQAGYDYGPPQVQRTPPNPPAYGQPQPSAAPGQPGYPPSQPPAQAGYGQSDVGAPRAAASPASYGGASTQSGAYPSAYGAPSVTPPSYGQQPPTYYGGAYSQPPAYPTDGNAPAPAPASQPAGQPSSQS